RLPHFFLEVSGWLTDGGESGHLEGAVVAHGGTMHASLPALSADPALQPLLPVRLVGIDPVGQLESRGVELKYRKAAELVAVGIEQLVVVNRGMPAKNPFAVGIQVGLRRLTLDKVAECVLTLVSMGKIKLVEEEQTSRQHCRYHQNG